MDFSILADSYLFSIMAESGNSRHIRRTELDAAVGALYDRYGRLVYSIAMQIVSDQGAAEEITQDVFLKAFENAVSYNPEISGASSWLAGITRHRAIDELRRRGVRPENYRADWPEDIGKETTAGLPALDGPERSVENAFESRLILKLIKSLPSDQQKALSLAFFQGYSHAEIADLLGEPLGTIKSRIRMGMQRMKELLLDKGKNY